MMSKQIEAIYENGVLRPLEPLGLDEHQRVTITIVEDSEGEEDLFDPAFTRWCAEQSNNAPSLEKVRKALAKVRTISLSTSIAFPRLARPGCPSWRASDQRLGRRSAPTAGTGHAPQDWVW
jgi:predicted DNA-binding antitoxin AbrB/MazE fold protein